MKDIKVEKKTQHEEWMEKIMKASNQDTYTNRIDNLEKEKKWAGEEVVSGKSKFSKRIFIVAVFLFVLAFVPRVYFVYFVSNPDNPGAGWFGDAYHHWQIAYLTKEIGLGENFLRLWDLKGMEYFWGLLHPLIVMTVFFVTGDNTVGMERATTAFFGSLSVVLVFLMLYKHWNIKTALAGAVFAALNPVGVFNDGTGMVEPLGITFLLMGIYFWPKISWLSGISFAIALMARGEYWLLSFALVFCMLIFTRTSSGKKIGLGLGFGTLTILYMKYLLSYTGNAIYPFYENFLANYVGTWQFKTELEVQDIMAKYIFLIVFIVAIGWSLLIVWRRPKGMFVYLLGLGNWIFLGAVFGLGAYIKSYMTYVWYVRFMILPYMFLGIVVSVGLFYYLPKPRFLRVISKLQFNWLIFVGLLLASQVLWVFIWGKYATTETAWQQSVKYAEGLAKFYDGGGLLLFEGNPEITYALVRFNGVEGRNIVGQMFDPYFYFSDDPYKDWGNKRKIVLSWLKKYNIRTIATYAQHTRYKKLVEYEPRFFYQEGTVPNTNFVIYKVKDEFYKASF